MPEIKYPSARPQDVRKDAACYKKTREFFENNDPRLPENVRNAAGAVLPTDAVSAVCRTSDGAVWTGGRHGLVRIDASAPERDRVMVMCGRRYLPDDDVKAVVPQGESVWAVCATGTAFIDMGRISLADKADYFEDEVVPRHIRHGFVTGTNFARPEDKTSARPETDDNDGLWTAMYASGKIFEHAATGSEKSFARAFDACDAVLRLTEMTPWDGYPARSYVTPDEAVPGGTWYEAADGSYTWKADTSSDEIVGHVLLFLLINDLMPDEGLKARARVNAAAIARHISDNGLYLVDQITGQPTTWGKWAPEYFEVNGFGYEDGPLNAIELLALFKVASHVTGDPRWEREYRRAAYDMKYADIACEYMERHGKYSINYSDEELAALAFYPLLILEKDALLLKKYRAALDGWWINMSREHNPLWDYIYKLARPEAEVDMDMSRWSLERHPMDVVAYSVDNTWRADLGLVPTERGLEREYDRLLPPDERRCSKYNTNIFQSDSDSAGRYEEDGNTFMLPYWLGRYHGFLEK